MQQLHAPKSYALLMQDGHWDDVSGETLLRTLLKMPIEHAAVPQVGSLLA